jgi:prolyl oligopeptidase
MGRGWGTEGQTPVFFTFTVGRSWVSEYGNTETSQEHFDFLYAYSPLYNVKEGLGNPPNLITSADTDARAP